MTTVRATIHVHGLAPGEVADLDTDLARSLMSQGWVERVRNPPKPFTSTPDDPNQGDDAKGSDAKGGDAKASSDDDDKRKTGGRKDSSG